MASPITIIGKAVYGTDEEWLERDDHPLLNDLILKRVFEKLRRYDLKSCRGVCKKWNEYALPHMRSTFQVTINGNKSKENSETRRIVDFVKLFKSNELGIPFEKYRLGPFRTTDGAGKQFLEICGNSIKEIVLFHERRVDDVRTIENFSELLMLSPKLESLTLSGQFVSRSGNVVKLFSHTVPILSALKQLSVFHYSSESPIKFCPTFFDELLTAARNLSHIATDDIGYELPPESEITLVVLNSIEKLGKESSIQSLSIESLSSKHFEILERMAKKSNGLKLKEISFAPTYPLEVDRNSYSTVEIRLATIFKDTLEYFNAFFGHGGYYLTEFPKMSKLKSFKFGVRIGHNAVNLNQIFPVIKTLSVCFEWVTHNLDLEDYSETLGLFSDFQVCPTIKTLFLEKNVTNIPTFLNILRVFPNLKKVTLRIQEDAGQVLRRIWGTMTQLESLSLVGCLRARDIMELDSIFTGISIHGLKQIRHVIPHFEKMTAEKRRDKIWNLVREYRTQELSIRNLTNLRYLKLDVLGGWKPIYNLSELSGYLAIYLMKYLKHLEIRQCEFKKKCCEILTLETGVEAWSFRTGEYEKMGPKHIIPPFQIPVRHSN